MKLLIHLKNILMLIKQILWVFLLLAGFSISCAYDSEEGLYSQNCDTLSVTYSGDIFPILDNNCLVCHANTVAEGSGGGLVLEGYSNVFEYRQGMLSAIMHEPGLSAMPKDAPQLDSCSIRKFEAWISSGSPDN